MFSPFQSSFHRDRRGCLRVLGGGVMLSMASLSGCSLNAVEPDDTSLAVNADVISTNDLRYRWLAQAAWAPSSHNMQPWKVVLTQDALTLYVDLQRLSPQADPTGRQVLVSLGAFMELLSMSAQADGYACTITLFPDGESVSAPVARIHTTLAAERIVPDALLAYVRQRHSHHHVYTPGQTPPPEALAALLAAADCHGISACGSLEAQQVAQISQRAAKAWQAELGAPDVLLETLSVTRIGRREIEAHRDGIAVQGFWPELAAWLGMFPRDRVSATDSTLMKNMLAMGEAQARSAAGWVWLTSPGNRPAQQLAAGRAYVRLHLAATQHGIALHPMSQALEAYPAMVEHHQGLYQDLSVESHETVQMLARIGYAAPGRASLRRPLNEFVRESA